MAVAFTFKLVRVKPCTSFDSRGFLAPAGRAMPTRHTRRQRSGDQSSCSRRGLPRNERSVRTLRGRSVFLAVCRASAYAHSNPHPARRL